MAIDEALRNQIEQLTQQAKAARADELQTSIAEIRVKGLVPYRRIPTRAYGYADPEWKPEASLKCYMPNGITGECLTPVRACAAAFRD
ncbi:hypothetical protein FSO04_44195 [Paraburkholderia madseniana]|uniref:Uncharacterized protein n=2 Tax=Paraburkholderia madseniana TaxID=2599607 RepID=A0A6N6VZ74_9BURK|nr:hypothetical protein FSO04_44195 [Paraburkholderia madseniana]